ncbi:transmembrane protein 39A [Aricia agestis]|uniref:transmembrane protein 39A n=1 Tax=Aricia agestis TaxID=91739 RepID=UPI001C20C21D|nr:transmembrane protein 39A [Aricia agestis]
MSCTENESGPFVVFFLPAVVGFLTILLARRWANSQVSTSSTAVSRRRKIIKDPLIKRPLPSITTKMVAPGSKKGTSGAKKAAPAASDEDANGCKRTKVRLSFAAPLSEMKLSENPSPPKHIPFPYIPQDGVLLFEIMTFAFTVVATGLQLLNVYRTVWWLPNSLTSEAMHFHLIDPHLVGFILAILSRRLFLSVTLSILSAAVSPKLIPHATLGARMFILGVVVGSMSWCAYFIILKYPLVKIFYLCYPAIIYLILFGFQVSPFIELHYVETPIMHCCSHDPEQIRIEVDTIREDFNLRVKKILFNSIIGAYYSSFVPCCFAQSFVYYDVRRCATQVGLVWGALCGRYAAQLLPAALLDAPHRAARHLGRWTKYEGEVSEASEWCGNRWWGAGAVARRGGQLYVAAAATVAADPAAVHHRRFYSVFNDPSNLLCLFLCLQLSLVVLQLCLLFSSFAWHNFIAVLMLLFINYYTLFKMVRDYLIAWKVYNAENIIQDKNNLVTVN